MLIDFETSVRSGDDDEKTKELRGLEKELLDDSGKGGPGKIDPIHIQEQLEEIYKRDGGWSEKLSRQADEGEITIKSEENKKLLEQMRAGRTAYIPV